MVHATPSLSLNATGNIHCRLAAPAEAAPEPPSLDEELALLKYYASKLQHACREVHVAAELRGAVTPRCCAHAALLEVLASALSLLLLTDLPVCQIHFSREPLHAAAFCCPADLASLPPSSSQFGSCGCRGACWAPR